MTKTVNICGIPHTVIMESDNFTAGGDSLGEIHYKEAKIYMSTGQAPAIEKETLCHEMLHGILLHVGEMGLSEDEGFVSKLAAAIAQGFDPIITVNKSRK